MRMEYRRILYHYYWHFLSWKSDSVRVGGRKNYILGSAGVQNLSSGCGGGCGGTHHYDAADGSLDYGFAGGMMSSMNGASNFAQICSGLQFLETDEDA